MKDDSIYFGYDIMSQSTVFMFRDEFFSICDRLIAEEGREIMDAALSNAEHLETETEETLDNGVVMILTSPWQRRADYEPVLWNKIKELAQ